MRKFLHLKFSKIKSLPTVLVRAKRQLKRLGFGYKQAKKVIKLTKRHKEHRLAMAEKWLRENTDWNRTIFSDEKKFNFDGPLMKIKKFIEMQDKWAVDRSCFWLHLLLMDAS